MTSIKILADFSVEIEKMILNFMYKWKDLKSLDNVEEEQSWRAYTTTFQDLL